MERKHIFLLVNLLLIGVGISFLFTLTDKLEPEVFQPVQLVVIFGAFFLPLKGSIALSILLPLIVSLVLKSPPFVYAGILLIAECVFQAIIANILYRKIKLNAILTLFFAQISGKIGLSLMGFVLTLFFSFGMNPLRYTLDAFIEGLPGFIIQLFLIPLFAYGLKKYTTIDIE